MGLSAVAVAAGGNRHLRLWRMPFVASGAADVVVGHAGQGQVGGGTGVALGAVAVAEGGCAGTGGTGQKEDGQEAPGEKRCPMTFHDVRAHRPMRPPSVRGKGGVAYTAHMTHRAFPVGPDVVASPGGLVKGKGLRRGALLE